MVSEALIYKARKTVIYKSKNANGRTKGSERGWFYRVVVFSK